MPGKFNSIDYFSARKNISLLSDTTITNENYQARDTSLQNATQPDTLVIADTTATIKMHGIDSHSVDSIMRLSEERARQIELQMQREATQRQPIYRVKTDTAKILFREFGIANFPVKERLEQDPFAQNFLLNFNAVKPYDQKKDQNVFVESEYGTDIGELKSFTEHKQSKGIDPQPIELKDQFNWITLLLIATFMLYGWIRFFNKKYFISLVKSTISYQEAHALYRDKNSLMQRASFITNLLFISNVSLFVVQLINFFNIRVTEFVEYEIYFLVFASLIGLYLFRAITSGFIGFVFLKQRVFAEYFHHINLFTKNTGIFLFPVIVALQYLSYDYLEFLVYIGLIIVVGLYLLHIVRSFQIINRKNVSIFYMILYLCAFEFSPFLIIYKMLLTLF
ncbi:MAG: DUF4271 domain-containing protein [Bacteroidales bacterium]